MNETDRAFLRLFCALGIWCLAILAAAELIDSGLHGIISFESFFRLKEDMLQPVREILSACECCIVIYLRRQSDYICSGLAQRMERRTPFYPLLLENGKFSLPALLKELV